VSAPNIVRMVSDHAGDNATELTDEIAAMSRRIALVSVELAETTAHRELNRVFGVVRDALRNAPTTKE